jgi:hypothetical protein
MKKKLTLIVAAGLVVVRAISNFRLQTQKTNAHVSFNAKAVVVCLIIIATVVVSCKRASEDSKYFNGEIIIVDTNVKPDTLRGEKVYIDGLYAGNTDVRVDEKYIYALYSNGHMFEGNTFNVFDWNGNFIKKIVLDKTAINLSISIDPVNKYLYIDALRSL